MSCPVTPEMTSLWPRNMCSSSSSRRSVPELTRAVRELQEWKVEHCCSTSSTEGTLTHDSVIKGKGISQFSGLWFVCHHEWTFLSPAKNPKRWMEPQTSVPLQMCSLALLHSLWGDEEYLPQIVNRPTNALCFTPQTDSQSCSVWPHFSVSRRKYWEIH